MSPETYRESELEARLEQVLADYLEAVEERRPPNRDMILARHPELAEELREFFAARDSVNALALRVQGVVPASLGNYELLEVLGAGTFGVVVKARKPPFPKPVALKLLRGGQWSMPEYVRRFWDEAQKAGTLDHPHIVPVVNLGEHQGQHFYEMKLIEGGSLTERLKGCTAAQRSSRAHQRWVARLLATVADAVHHAHKHGLIHRDLKPGNIVLDLEGKPNVTDFGLAKRLKEGEQFVRPDPGEGERWSWEGGPEADTVMTEEGLIVGTAPYMSPEQAEGLELSTASDVYSLGIILYEMLTGQVPIRGATPKETIQMVRVQVPAPPTTLNPRIDKRLEKICLKCLQRNPGDRYGSALGLARNLERWADDLPLLDPADGRARRLWLACKRNPVNAVLTAVAAALFLVVMVGAVFSARSRAARLEEEVLRGNAYAARGAAVEVMRQWEKYGTPLRETAESPELRALMRKEDPRELQEFVERAARSWNDRLRTPDGNEAPILGSRVLNREGVLLASGPERVATIGKSYKGRRDYFDGTMKAAEGTTATTVYVSRVFKAESDGLFKIALSAPIRDPEKPGSPVIGVITATLTTDPTMGLPHLHDARRKAVLVGRQDGPDSTDRIVLHPAFRHGEEPVAIAHPKLQAILERQAGLDQQARPASPQGLDLGAVSDGNYFDPVASRDPDYGGRWLAGFAPVGDTEFAVVVQQSYDDAIPPDSDILAPVVLMLIGVLLIAAFRGLVALWWPARPRDEGPGSPDRK